MEGQIATADSSPGEPSTRLAINSWFIAATETIAAFMELLDTSIADVALPYIGRHHNRITSRQGVHYTVLRGLKIQARTSMYISKDGTGSRLKS
jgi:hypothetical protein